MKREIKDELVNAALGVLFLVFGLVLFFMGNIACKVVGVLSMITFLVVEFFALDNIIYIMKEKEEEGK